MDVLSTLVSTLLPIALSLGSALGFEMPAIGGAHVSGGQHHVSMQVAPRAK